MRNYSYLLIIGLFMLTACGGVQEEYNDCQTMKYQIFGSASSYSEYQYTFSDIKEAWGEPKRYFSYGEGTHVAIWDGLKLLKGSEKIFCRPTEIELTFHENSKRSYSTNKTVKSTIQDHHYVSKIECWCR